MSTKKEVLDIFKWIKLQYALLFLLPVIFMRFLTVDEDIWWHLKMGEYIFTHGAVLHADIFSFSAQGVPWLMHEWLAELFMYVTYKFTGYYGILCLFVTALTLLHILLYRLTNLRTNRPIPSAIVVLVVAVLTRPFLMFRPFILAYVLFMGMLYILELNRQHNSRLIWVLPVIMLIWVNIHASFIIGFYLLGIYILSGAFNIRIGRIVSQKQSGENLRNLVCCLLLSLGAVFINPYGYRTILYPFSTVGTSVIINGIAEWVSPNFHEIYYVLVIFLLLGILMFLIACQCQVIINDIMLLFLFTGMALYSVRFTILDLFIMAPIGAYYESKLLSSQAVKSVRIPLLNWFVIGVSVVGIVMSWPTTNDLLAQTDYQRLPVGAVKYMEANNIRGNVFNSFNWGGYLLWHRYPANKVFVDGRVDMYLRRELAEAFSIYDMVPGALSRLKEYSPDLILLERYAPLNEGLKYNNEWKVIYKDKTAVLYARNKNIPGKT